MKAAIVDGYSSGSELARLLALDGVECLHLRSAPEFDGFFARTFRPQDYVEDLGYVADEQQLIRRLAALGVDRVVAGTESGVILADTLSYALGLPGNSLELVHARRDKALMMPAVAAAGLAVPAGQVCGSVEQAVAWYELQAGRAAVVKPLASAGTDNVHFCVSAAEVRAAAASVLHSRDLYGAVNRRLLVQQRVVGTEFYVNTVSTGGVHHIAEIWRYTKTISAAGSPIYDFEEPIAADAGEARIVVEFVFAALDALGIRSSAAHTEVMLSAAGPVFIESGARLGGATIPDVVEKLCGVSQASLFARAIVDPDSLRWKRPRFRPGPAAVRNVALICPNPVRRQRADWLDRLDALPTLVASSALPRPGAPLPETVDLMSSPGYVYLAAEDLAAVDRDYRQLREWERSRLYGD